jgi:hypothetical protein
MGRYGNPGSEPYDRDRDRVQAASVYTNSAGASVANGTTVYIGIENGQAHLYLTEDDELAIDWLQRDPVNNDMGAMAPTRRMFRAQFTALVELEVAPPIPAALKVKHG